MSLVPNIFLYQEHNSLFGIFISEISTVRCLNYLEPDTSLEIVSFGATCYKHYGYATEKCIPKLKTVKELSIFLEAEQDIGLIELEVKFDTIGRLSTHDDTEANFTFNNKKLCLTYLKKILPVEYSGLIIDNLLNNQGIYISCDRLGNISKYVTFEQGISNSKNIRDL